MLGCAAVVSVAASAPLTVRLASVPTLVMFGCAAVVSVPVSDVKRPLAARTSSAPPGSAPTSRDVAKYPVRGRLAPNVPMSNVLSVAHETVPLNCAPASPITDPLMRIPPPTRTISAPPGSVPIMASDP